MMPFGDKRDDGDKYSPPKPAGAEYVCVVREPTREMTMAACGVLPSVEGVSGHAGKLCAEVYRTMLAASPRPAPDAGVIERVALALHRHEWRDQTMTISTEAEKQYWYESARVALEAAGLLKGAEANTPAAGGDVIEAALAAYNDIWQKAEGIDAHNADAVRRKAMTAALSAASLLRAEGCEDVAGMREAVLKFAKKMRKSNKLQGPREYQNDPKAMRVWQKALYHEGKDLEELVRALPAPVPAPVNRNAVENANWFAGLIESAGEPILGPSEWELLAKTLRTIALLPAGTACINADHFALIMEECDLPEFGRGRAAVQIAEYLEGKRPL